MKLNVTKVLNTILIEEGMVEENTDTHPLEGKANLDWYEEYQLKCWREAQEEKRKAIEPWGDVADIEDYYCEWLQEKDMSEYCNDLAFRECDRLMWEGKDYSHVHFAKIPTFDEWMEARMETMSKYLVVVA